MLTYDDLVSFVKDPDMAESYTEHTQEWANAFKPVRNIKDIKPGETYVLLTAQIYLTDHPHMDDPGISYLLDRADEIRAYTRGEDADVSNNFTGSIFTVFNDDMILIGRPIALFDCSDGPGGTCDPFHTITMPRLYEFEISTLSLSDHVIFHIPKHIVEQCGNVLDWPNCAIKMRETRQAAVGALTHQLPSGLPAQIGSYLGGRRRRRTSRVTRRHKKQSRRQRKHSRRTRRRK